MLVNKQTKITLTALRKCGILGNCIIVGPPSKNLIKKSNIKIVDSYKI